MKETMLERQTRLDREARARVEQEDLERAARAVPSDGRCCGAPPEPIATPRFAEWHRRGACFGGSTPCRRAADCEAVYRRLYNRGWATLADAHEPQQGNHGAGGGTFIQLEPGECCGAPPTPEPTGKYVRRHYSRRTPVCSAAKACESLDGQLRYRRKQAQR